MAEILVHGFELVVILNRSELLFLVVEICSLKSLFHLFLPVGRISFGSF